MLNVHRRNGGNLSNLDFGWRFLEAALLLDSLDLAEILALLEVKYQYAPFEAPTLPSTFNSP